MSLLSKLKRKINPHAGFPGTSNYWENRYKQGGNSGEGSYNYLAEFKAKVINELLKKYNITSVIEFGCGDGNQLSLCNYQKYIGLDVSKTAITLCIEKFKNDQGKSFFLYDSIAFQDNHGVFKADASFSLDVLYHLIEEDVFEKYLRHLFQSASQHVVIYSSNDTQYESFHEKNRSFTKWINMNIRGWELAEKIDNIHRNDTKADFFIYRKK
jgi:SAM-dependent methyltransferase